MNSPDQDINDTKVNYEESLKKIRFGHYMIIFLALISTTAAIYHKIYFQMAPIVMMPYYALMIAYILMAVFYYKNPYEISITALCLYVALVLITVNDREYIILYLGIFHASVIISLGTAINHGHKYKRTKEKLRTEATSVIDDDMINDFE